MRIVILNCMNVDEATLSDHSPIILDVDLSRFGQSELTQVQ